MLKYKSQNTSSCPKDLKKIGNNVTIEEGAKFINPQNISLGDNVYIGHNAVLNAYLKNNLEIGNNVWIGANCYLHSAGGIRIEDSVGIGPGVKMISSLHDLEKDDLGPIINLPLKFSPISIEKGSDIGLGAIIMPGVTISEGTQVAAGAVVTKNTPRYSIVAGVPAKKIGVRQSAYEKPNRQKLTFPGQIKKIIIQLSGCLADIIFILALPLIITYSWFRFLVKRIFKIKPKILISPLGAPLPFFAVKAIRTQSWMADNLAFNVPSFFRDLSFGLVLEDRKILHLFTVLTDYVFLFLWALLKYDLFEFPFSGGILTHSHWRKWELPLLKICAKKVAVYGYGSDCKVLSDVRAQGFKYNNAMDRTEETESQKEATIKANVQRARRYTDVLIAGGDLIHFGKKGVMLPLATDLSNWQATPKKKNKIIKILHSTNHRSHKGSRFIIEIIEKMEKKLPVKLILLEKKTIRDCQKIYPQADIFIPDVITGWHGFTAIEAMACAKPVITYLRDDIWKFHAYYAREIPAISANPDNLAQVVTKLVKNAKLREELGKKGRKYALKYHSLEFVGALRKILYEHIWQGKEINQGIFEREARKRKLISK